MRGLRPTARAITLAKWGMLILICAMIGWASGGLSWGEDGYGPTPGSARCEVITVEDGYSFCDG